MNRNFIRAEGRQEPKTGDRQLISVIGIGQGVGTTTVASTLALCFFEKGKSVTFLEGSNGAMASNLLYCQVAMEQRFANRHFTDFYGLAHRDESLLEKDNFEEGINWILITPENKTEGISLNHHQQDRLLRRASSDDVTILDITDNTGWEDMMIDSHVIIGVIDPLPSKMITNVGTFRKVKKLESRGHKVFWIVNKYNKGVSRHQVKEYIKSNNMLWIDNVAIEKMYSQQYSCRFHWKNEEICSKIMDIFTEISH